MPALVASFSGDSFVSFSHLQTLFAVVQLAGGLLCGPLFDVKGARWGLIVSFLASALAYALAALAGSMPLLYLSRIPTLWQHAALAARIAVMSHGSDAHTNAALLGYLGVAATLGMCLGPLAGGILSSHSLQTPLVAAALGSLASAASVWLFMPSAAPRPASGEAPPAARKMASLDDLARVFRLPGVSALLASKAVLSLAGALFNPAFALAATSLFGLSPAELGVLLSALSCVAVLTQAFLIEAALARFTLAVVNDVSLFVLIVSFTGTALAGSIRAITFWLVPMSAATCVLLTLNTAELNHYSRAQAGVGPGADSGWVNALDMSVASGIRVVTPSLAVALLTGFGFSSIGVVGASTLALLFVVQRVGGMRGEGGEQGATMAASG